MAKFIDVEKWCFDDEICAVSNYFVIIYLIVKMCLILIKVKSLKNGQKL